MSEPDPSALAGWPSAGERAKDPLRERFRHNLARIMGERGLSQAELARRLDVSRVAVHAWIWGACFPETGRLIGLAQALDVSIGALLDSGTQAESGTAAKASDDEALLLAVFNKLPSAARQQLLTSAYESLAETQSQSAGLERLAVAIGRGRP